MSIRFNMMKLFVRITGMKKFFSKPQDELLEAAKKMNRRRGFKIPKRKGLHYTDLIISGRYHCLKIQTQEGSYRRALLYLYGGGHITAPDDGDVKTAERIGTRSGRDVWFPYYPLCTEGTIKDSFEMVYAVYQEMLRQYRPKDIALLGFSSGGALAIGLCSHNNEQAVPLPMPGLLIVSSPGSIPMSRKEWEKMEALSKKDILLDAHFMVTIRAIMEHGTTVPDYMLSGIKGNFTNFPMTHFYYGSHEVLYAEAPYFTGACKKYKVPYRMHIGKGLCHCYPAFTFFPEGKKAQTEIIELL